MSATSEPSSGLRSESYGWEWGLLFPCKGSWHLAMGMNGFCICFCRHYRASLEPSVGAASRKYHIA